MTGAVGNTTFKEINDEMMNGSIKVGKTAAEVTAKYQSETASTAKRVFLGILTFGGYAIYHACKDSRYRSEMKALCKGTQDFYNQVSKLANPKEGMVDNLKGKMCNEDVLFSKNTNDQIFVTFKDKSQHEVKDPQQLVKNIEMDVMGHSEYFDKNFIVDGILKKYKDGLAADKEEAGHENDVWRKLDDVDQKYNSEDLDIEDRFNQANDLSKIKPRLAECKEQFDKLLAKLFESRLGLDPAETKYIDRDIGIKLAEDVMNGAIATAADARAFINRNASATHFTTVESARIFEQFEAAQIEEANASNVSSRNFSNADDKKTPLKSVNFEDGYNQTRDNSALPAGQIKAVHDFVANLVSDLNTVKQDRDLTHDASDKNIKDGTKITEGQRLRELFRYNVDTLALLMANRAKCLKEPGTPSLLRGIEPKFQEALNAELDKINAKYDEKVKDARSLVESSKESYQKYLDQGNDPKSPFMANARESWRQREDRLYFLENDKNGISNFLREELKNEAVQSGKIKTFFNASNIDDISNAELNELGHIDNVRNQLEERLGKYYDLSEKREQLTLGAHFFADMEVRLNKAADEGCKDLQTNVSKMIENVFPNPGNKVAHDPNSLAQASLGDIIGGPAEDNQLQLVKEAMKIYFQKMPVMDQRAMLAAEMRYCAITDKTTEGARLGAILKGAGPIMQKMMQGLDPAMFAKSPDFQIAISDMKDKLAPISQDAVHAYLYDVVKNSGGAISKIAVKKALGAASVAQALKCTVTLADGSSKDCVIKILRPDAEMKARREFAIFSEAAKKVGHGMDVTFQGQFNSILAEMDLTNEAKNVASGNTVYSYNKKDYTNESIRQTYGSFSNVSSMKLAEGIPATKNVMVLEEVPGTTMEQYLIDTRKKSQEVVTETGNSIKDTSPENAPSIALDGYNELDKLYTDVKKKYDALVNLSYMWVNEGLFAAGFYHGDIHKGNIMTQAGWQKGNPPDSGITLIDFGNASNLDKKERSFVVKVVAGSATKDARLYLEGYKGLLSKDSLNKFEANQAEIQEKLNAIFAKGTLKDTAARMQAAIKILQEDYAIEVPAPIHNFMESQRRLQNALDDTLAVMKDIADQKKTLIANYQNGFEDGEVREKIAEGIAQADNYRPKTLINAITDVVKQNLYSAMMSIGNPRKAKECYDKIKNDADFQIGQAENGVNVLEV
jgi:predicted unusual protein kinase regulating ubiquinone biosynthesis (AarF/ABC1/UbiB family)